MLKNNSLSIAFIACTLVIGQSAVCGETSQASVPGYVHEGRYRRTLHSPIKLIALKPLSENEIMERSLAFGICPNCKEQFNSDYSLLNHECNLRKPRMGKNGNARAARKAMKTIIRGKYYNNS